jgi:hypothetical protein
MRSAVQFAALAAVNCTLERLAKTTVPLAAPVAVN